MSAMMLERILDGHQHADSPVPEDSVVKFADQIETLLAGAKQYGLQSAMMSILVKTGHFHDASRDALQAQTPPSQRQRQTAYALPDQTSRPFASRRTYRSSTVTSRSVAHQRDPTNRARAACSPTSTPALAPRSSSLSCHAS